MAPLWVKDAENALNSKRMHETHTLSRLLRTFLTALILAAPLGSAVPLRAAPSPNVVLILADDLGYGSVGCYGAKPELVRTPNIDRLAKEGRRFTDANTPCSVCSPTRYSVLTGRYAWRTRLTSGVLGVFEPLLIETNRLTLASLLKQRGYATAAIGKWHLGYGAAPKLDYTGELRPGPLEVGFDYHFGVPSNHGDVTGVYVENHRVCGLRSARLTPRVQAGTNFNGAPFVGLDAPHRVNEGTMPQLTAKAVNWLNQQSSAKPFFLYFTPVAVHNPVTPSSTTKGSSRAGAFGDWIHELDRCVGEVLAALDKRGLANTIVLFTSDNGGVNHTRAQNVQTAAIKAGLKVNGPFRGGKHNVWEGGFRVPYIVRWPSRVPARTSCDEMLSLADTLATVAGVLGAKLPPQGAAEDSYDMSPTWLGVEHKTPIRPNMIVHSADGVFAIRRGPWKWIEGAPAKGAEAPRARADEFHAQLYNLDQDIAETKDLADAQADELNKLKLLLNQQRDQGSSSKRLSLAE